MVISLNKPWSASDLDSLRKYYQETPDEAFSVKAIAVALGRTEDAVTLKAGRSGWTKNRERKSDATRLNMSAAQKESAKRPEIIEQNKKRAKEQIKKYGHPRGMLGKKHTTETKQAISINTKETWSRPECRLNSQEYRQQLSDRFSKMAVERTPESVYSKSARGKRADLGDYFFRSSWEANYARYLNFLQKNGDIEKWEYEPDTFWFHKILRGVRSYKPDFKVWEKGKIFYVELKGWMDARSKTKLKRMKKYYPAIEVRLVGEKQYKDLARKIGSIIVGWESVTAKSRARRNKRLSR